VKFTNISGKDDREYTIAEADYDPILGLLVDLWSSSFHLSRSWDV